MKQNRIQVLLIMAMMTLPVLAAEDEGGSFLPFWLEIPLYLIGIIIIPVALIILFVGMYKKVFSTIWYVISLQPLRRRLLRQRLSAGLEYFREPPAGGDLKVANIVMNSLSSAWLSDYKGLFGALILRLVDKGALQMEYKSNVYGAEPHVVLSVNEWPGGIAENEETWLEQSFHNLLYQAAGSDKVLQPREIQHFIRNNDSDFLPSLTTLTDAQREKVKDPQTAQQLLAFRKFLLDFSLIKERDIKEMSLWKEYLVYAIFYGIADKVCENFEEVYPDYFKGNALASMRLNIVGNNALVTYVDAANKGVKESESNSQKQVKA